MQISYSAKYSEKSNGSDTIQESIPQRGKADGAKIDILSCRFHRPSFNVLYKLFS
jgi:hypothetical protein